jgi:hypothetical protein
MIRLILAITLAFFISCTGADQKNQSAKNLKKSDARTSVDKISRYISILNEINKNSPSSISADMEIDGTFGKRKIRTTGKLLYSAEPLMMNLNLFDFIFKSPLLSVHQEGLAIRIYSPAEKKVFADNIKTIIFKNYIGAPVDFMILYSLITGKVPLIDDYKVKSFIEDGRGNYLILENKTLYQTVSFDGDIPDKILIMNKDTQDKYEIYFTPVKKEKSAYYRKLKFVMNSVGIKFDIAFNYIVLNSQLKLKTISEMKIPNDVPVVNVGP